MRKEVFVLFGKIFIYFTLFIASLIFMRTREYSIIADNRQK